MCKCCTQSGLAAIAAFGNCDVNCKGRALAVEIRCHSIWARRHHGLEFISWEATRTPDKQ